MSVTDTLFAGSIPGLYDRYLGPLLFQPYAKEVARRAAALDPPRILETAAGTGIVTEALHRSVLEAEITATDLNPAMLDIGAQRIDSDKVSFQPADALELPFGEGSFDLVVCQFGVMFFPDKVKGNAEARRVLREGGHYLLAAWDRIERNGLSKLANDSMRDAFPDNPPKFMERGPFSYHEPEWIERDLREAGFNRIEIETVALKSRSSSAENAARGLCYGSPMGVELEEYGPGALERVFEDFRQSACRYEGANGFEAPMAAHIVAATK